MGWVFGIGILILLVISAGFRKFALVIVGFCIVVCIVAFLIYYINDKKEEKLALSRISIEELKFEDINLKEYSGGYRLSGRVFNRSNKFTLKTIMVKVTAEDCSDESEKKCVVIGEDNQSIFLNIPSGQARDFSEGASLHLTPKGHLVWNYSVVEIKGE